VSSYGVELAVALLFALSALEKFSHVAHRSAAWHPAVITSGWLRRHGQPAMCASAVLDSVLAIGLVRGTPGAGLASALVTVMYTPIGLRTFTAGDGAPCRCFGAFASPRSPLALVGRNTLVVIAASAGGVAAGENALTPGAAVSGALALAAIALAARVRLPMRTLVPVR